MAYQKHELLGTNKDGSTPKRGPKTIHANVKEPLAHDHSRDFEKVAGTVAKRHTVEIHSGMHRTTGTNDGAPVTSPLVDDEKMDISPVVDGGKVGIRGGAKSWAHWLTEASGKSVCRACRARRIDIRGSLRE